MRYVFIVYYNDTIYGKKLTDKSTKAFLDFNAAQNYCNECNENGRWASYKLQMLELEEPKDSNDYHGKSKQGYD